MSLTGRDKKIGDRDGMGMDALCIVDSTSSNWVWWRSKVCISDRLIQPFWEADALPLKSNAHRCPSLALLPRVNRCKSSIRLWEIDSLCPFPIQAIRTYCNTPESNFRGEGDITCILTMAYSLDLKYSPIYVQSACTVVYVHSVHPWYGGKSIPPRQNPTTKKI